MLNLNLGGYTHLNPNECLKYTRSVFPDSTIYFKLDDNIHFGSKGVKIWCRLNTFHDIFELMLAVDALRRVNTRYLEVVIPYIPFAQQDRLFKNQPFSLKVFAKLINQLKFYKVHAVDCHSSSCEILIKNLVEKSNQEFIQKVCSDLKKQGIPTGSLNFISPDAGAAKKICKTLSFLENPNIVVCQKERDPSTNELTKTVVPIIKNEWPCLIVDDIILAGGSCKNIVSKMRQNGNNNPVYVACTHGIFPKGQETIDSLKPFFSWIYISDSRGEEKLDDGFVIKIPLFN